MARLMNKNGCLDLAKKLIEKHPDILNSPEGFLLHLGDTYDIAGEVVDASFSRYPGLRLKLSKEEVALAAGLHDIGRPLSDKTQVFHELIGASYIEDEGIKENVADSLATIYRIAQMFRPHYLVAEQYEDAENSITKAKLKPIDPLLLLPRTWQEFIVIYSELSNINSKRVSIQERIADVKNRYANDPEYNQNTSFIRAMQSGLPES
ncbi:hypothetical protein J4405_01195 [Candidatus Woesearchaeota archaeon]|nr:hypothetical protein [Candidatus Woesearchaeota archaeon]